MKKINFIYVLGILFSLSLVSCKTVYEIKNESKPSNDLSKYKKIYVDWLDLKEEDWKVGGYNSIDEWKVVINEMNILGLHKWIKEDFPDKEFKFAKSPSDEPTKDMDLYIKFSDYKLKNLGWPHRKVILSVTIHFIDINTNMEKHSASIDAFGYTSIWPNFEHKLNEAVYNIAVFLKEKLG